MVHQRLVLVLKSSIQANSKQFTDLNQKIPAYAGIFFCHFFSAYAFFFFAVELRLSLLAGLAALVRPSRAGTSAPSYCN